MDHERFRDWFSRVDELIAAQRKEVAAVLSDPPEGAASLAAIELGLDDGWRCAHCGTGGAVSRGKARGLRRFRCKACGKTFGLLTGAALSGLHHKEHWLSFGASLAEGETIKEFAARCGIAPSTAHRWRHRFPAAVRQAPERLAGIVAADETFVLDSRKGQRKPDRKPRRRGGKAKKRGLSREQVPVLAPDALLASGSGAPCTSRRSTAAKSRSRAFCAGGAASPPSTSTAIRGGSISSNSAIGHRRERVSKRQWPSQAYVSPFEPHFMSTGPSRHPAGWRPSARRSDGRAYR